MAAARSLLDPLPEYSAGVSHSVIGWHYGVCRGDTRPRLLDAREYRFGVCPTREQAWACALAELKGMMRVDRAKRSP